jgi:hypothetical protein
MFFEEQGIRSSPDNSTADVSVHCSHTSFPPAERDLFSPAFLQSEEEQMAGGWRSRERDGEAFWRAHHEAWQQSDLNQREYCEAHSLSLKASTSCGAAGRSHGASHEILVSGPQ